MNKRIFTRVLCLLMCVVLLAGCSYLPFGNTSDAGERRVIPFSEMEYERPDSDAIVERLEELTDLIEDAGSFNKLMEYDAEASELVENFYTMNTLAMLHYYKDMTDTYYDEEYRYCEDAGVDVSLALTNLNKAIVEGPYAEDYREAVGDYVFQSMENDLLLNSDTVKEYKRERTQIETDYGQALSTLTLSYEGQEYTYEDIDEIYYTDGYSTYYKLLVLYYQANAPVFTEYYRRLVELDKLIARELGFEKPADMYYLSYARDFTPEEGLAFCEQSKELFVPVVTAIDDLYYSTGGAVEPTSYNSTIRALPGIMASIDPELEECWDFMMDYELFDYENTANRYPGAFNTSLPAYDASFCFGTFGGESFNDTTTIIHEFGHFYESWLWWDQSVVFNLDIAEIYSQGLEVLTMESYDDLLSNSSDVGAAQMQVLRGLTNPFSYQLLLEEFQYRTYEMETFDENVLANLYTELLEEYGMADYIMADENGLDHSWFEVTHLFEVPFYTISYATSAMVALQIWAAAQDNWQDGVDIYMNLIHADQNQPFVQLVEGAGLGNPLQARSMRDVIAVLEDKLDI